MRNLKARQVLVAGMTEAQIHLLQKHGAGEGCHPGVVAADVVRSVESDDGLLLTGPGARLGYNAMRASRRMARRLTID